ncbi:hypothetical protein [Streptomyces sp. NPDC094032]|uniref:hypothetical protein n=1 Tax=Streptomyces sp. NPDC094032 TaxID=3155308 RepID=UPI00332629FA
MFLLKHHSRPLVHGAVLRRRLSWPSGRRVPAVGLAAVLLAAGAASPVTAEAGGAPAAAPGVDLTCTTSAVVTFAPPLTAKPQNVTVTISAGKAASCVDTSGNATTIASGTFAATLGATGLSCLNPTAQTTGTAQFSWKLAPSGTATTNVTSLSIGADVNGETLLTGQATAGDRLVGDTFAFAGDVTSASLGQLCLLTLAGGPPVSTAVMRGVSTFTRL